MKEFDLKTAISNPSSVFDDPNEVMQADISKEDKIKILQSWEYDLRDISVAEEENMGDIEHPETEHLSIIHDILDQLNALDDSGDTKQ